MSECRPVVGMEHRYTISDLGVVRNKRTGMARTPQTLPKGYKTVCLWNGTKYVTRLIHRLVAESFIPNPNKYPCVNHINFDPSDNRVENLEWCSYQMNAHHTCRAGRGFIPALKGANNGRSAVTETTIRLIFQLSRLGMTQHDIGSRVGLTQTSVSKILTGRTWRHLTTTPHD